MKMTVLLMIDTDKEENVTVQAFSKVSANIYVTAANMDKAQALLTTGRQQAEEAMASWTPEQEEPAPAPADQNQKHYVFYTGKSIEDMNEEASAYEDTPAGQRFIKRIDNARAFYFKHSKGGLLMSEVNYLANTHRNSLVNGSMDLTALAYRRGYKEGQKKAAGKKK